LNVILNSDYDNSGFGSVSLLNASINTNGGNFVVGGGSDPVTGYALGTSTQTLGVNISATSINTGAGNIAINGKSDLIATAPGVSINTGSSVNSGSGTITINGFGEKTTGVLLNGSTISSGTGNINVTGDAKANYAIYLINTSTIQSSSGNITINLPTAYSSNGIALQSGTNTITTGGAGSILIDAASNLQLWGNTNIGATGSGSLTIYSRTQPFVSYYSNNTIGNAGMTGDITIYAPSFSIYNQSSYSIGYSTITTFVDTKFITQGAIRLIPTSSTLEVNGAAVQTNGKPSFLANSSSLYVTNLLSLITGASSFVLGDASSSYALSVADGWNLSSYAFPIQVYGGNIVTGGINAGSNALTLNANTGNITLTGATPLTSTASGNAIVLQAANGNFINNSGLTTALSTPNGRYIIYSSNPLNDTYGSMPLPSRRYGAPQAGDTGSYIYYTSYVPTLTIRAKNQSITYGDGILNDASGYEIDLSTLVSGDTLSSVLSGSGSIATNYTNAGNYLGGITLSQGTFTSLIGYTINLVAGDLTINKAALTIRANDATRSIGENNPLFAYTTQGLRPWHILSDVMSDFQVSSDATSISAPGVYRIMAEGTLVNPNYTVTRSEGILRVTPKFGASNNENVIQARMAAEKQFFAGTGTPIAIISATVRCAEERDTRAVSCKTSSSPLLGN
jgi:hypothetical protein